MYRLREIEDRDMPVVNAWRNNPKLISMLGAPYRYINQSVDTNWFDGYMKNRQSQVCCTIVTDECDEMVMLVMLRLHNIKIYFRKETISYEKNRYFWSYR